MRTGASRQRIRPCTKNRRRRRLAPSGRTSAKIDLEKGKCRRRDFTYTDTGRAKNAGGSDRQGRASEVQEGGRDTPRSVAVLSCLFYRYRQDVTGERLAIRETSSSWKKLIREFAAEHPLSLRNNSKFYRAPVEE